MRKPPGVSAQGEAHLLQASDCMMLGSVTRGTCLPSILVDACLGLDRSQITVAVPPPVVSHKITTGRSTETVT